jgi:hypothetical protein
MCCQHTNDVGDPGDGRTGSQVDVLPTVSSLSWGRKAESAHFILVRIDSLSVKPFLSLLVVLLGVLADPDVPVQAQNEVHSARERDEV